MATPVRRSAYVDRTAHLSPVSTTRVYGPSSRAELTGVKNAPELTFFNTRQLRPLTQVSKNAPEFTGRQLGP